MINFHSLINDKSLGLVLCGGNSSRMKSDKGLLTYANETWARIAFNKLESLGLSVKLSVNSKQMMDYAQEFDETLLLEDSDSLAIKGPLKGILSTHMIYPDRDIFILACDMLLMRRQNLEQLFELKIKNSSNDIYLFKNSEHKEPLCGIYTANALSKISNMFENRTLNNYSMKSALEKLKVYELPIDQKYLANFNKKEDIKTP